MIRLLDKLNIVKSLQVAAIAIFALHLFNVMATFVRLLRPYDPINMEYVLGALFTVCMQLIAGFFQPLVLLGLAELIRIKKGK